ncbi:hypothetical protein [Synechococcus sp. UW179A]|uniref:hypothetical protein n=1 Tax=Synechococcus sp. UW179A TaxID=2575510 RepID=UPI000E0EB2FD|nr:hypothetical protein [Synechococcus sp. UW179A]
MDSKHIEQLFQSAFGREETVSPRAVTGSRYRMNATRMMNLSFAEKMEVQAYIDQDVPYADLPAWVIDGGYVEPTKAEKKRQQQLNDATGLSISERKQVFNAALADTQILAEMTVSEILRDSQAIDSEIQHFLKKYGDQAMTMLEELDADAATYVHARLRVQSAEKKVTDSDESVRQEIQQAKAMIDAQNSAVGLENISAEAMQAELARRASMATQEAAAQGE